MDSVYTLLAPDFVAWLERPKWTIREAALLLLGISPDHFLQNGQLPEDAWLELNQLESSLRESAGPRYRSQYLHTSDGQKVLYKRGRALPAPPGGWLDVEEHPLDDIDEDGWKKALVLTSDVLLWAKQRKYQLPYRLRIEAWVRGLMPGASQPRRIDLVILRELRNGPKPASGFVGEKDEDGEVYDLDSIKRALRRLMGLGLVANTRGLGYFRLDNSPRP